MKSNEEKQAEFGSLAQLSVLYEKQEGILRLLRIHERNLQVLREQEALHGISVPLNIVNGIRKETSDIDELKAELGVVSGEIEALTRRSPKPSHQGSKLGVWFEVDGANLPIEFPYPLLGQASEISENGVISSVIRYAGGFEMRSMVHPKEGTKANFFRHGRQIAPLVDSVRKKLIIPIGDSVVVGSVSMNLGKRSSAIDLPPNEDSSGGWEFVKPAAMQRSVIYSDWPQGSGDIVMTKRTVFERSLEVWVVQAVNEEEQHGVRLWFYVGDLLVKPQVDVVNRRLSFPDY